MITKELLLRVALLLLIFYLLSLNTVPAQEKRVALEMQLGEKIPLELTFTDSNGQQVQLANLIDRPTLIVPVFYNCRTVCNVLLGGLSSTLPKMRLTPGKDYQVITLSFDPEETVAMAAHSQRTFLTATRIDFPPEAWHFLTGEQENILKLTDSAGYFFYKEGDNFVHPTAAFIVGADGTIVRYLIGQSIPPITLTMAILEAAEGRISTPISKALEFCFTYDAENRRYVFNLLRVSGTVILLTLGSFFLFLFFSGRKKKS
ncbi:MAG: SCO family protein [Desulfuromonadales bacterium]|nr:SCO family protein [Desulfuromonadales bacterium]